MSSTHPPPGLNLTSFSPPHLPPIVLHFETMGLFEHPKKLQQLGLYNSLAEFSFRRFTDLSWLAASRAFRLEIDLVPPCEEKLRLQKAFALLDFWITTTCLEADRLRLSMKLSHASSASGFSLPLGSVSVKKGVEYLDSLNQAVNCFRDVNIRTRLRAAFSDLRITSLVQEASRELARVREQCRQSAGKPKLFESGIARRRRPIIGTLEESSGQFLDENDSSRPDAMGPETRQR